MALAYFRIAVKHKADAFKTCLLHIIYVLIAHFSFGLDYGVVHRCAAYNATQVQSDVHSHMRSSARASTDGGARAHLLLRLKCKRA